MARGRREWYPGAIYHLVSRGNRHQNIFEEASDFKYFLMLLADIQKRYPFDLHSYCLMTNHFHMLLETKDHEVWVIMKRLNQVYTGYYNEKYSLNGHLFQGRYHSSLVKDDAYFLQTSRYIHLNPVKAQMVSHPEEYPWSSYRALIGMADQSIVASGKTLGYFEQPQNMAYRQFVEQNTASEEQYEGG